MAPHLLKGASGTPANQVDIELDKDYVVFEGTAQEALGVYLSGHLVLRVNEHLPVKNIKLQLSGVRRISLPTKSGWKKVTREEEFYGRGWEFGETNQPSPKVLAPGVYKYPFNVVLEGSLPESVEGLKEASIAYSFEARIRRKHGKDLTSRKPLRVIRVPDMYVHEQALDETWAQKLAYRIYIPNTAVAFGMPLELNYSFIPLVRGLRIEYIESQILETREFALDGGQVVSGRDALTATVLCSDIFTMDDTAEDTIKGADGYQFARSLQPPKALGRCLQDADVSGIRVKHKIRVVVRMRNPDGHCSELRLRIPMSIYLSPQYRVWDAASEGTLPSPEVLGSNDEPPPPYGRHALDQLYEPQQILA